LKKSKRDINVVKNIDHNYNDTDISYPEFYDELNTNYNYLNIYSGEESQNVSNNDYTNPLKVATKHCVGNKNEGKYEVMTDQKEKKNSVHLYLIMKTNNK
jgi:hypothetical protein